MRNDAAERACAPGGVGFPRAASVNGMQQKFPSYSIFVDEKIFTRQHELLIKYLLLNKGIIVKTTYQRLALAITLLAGCHLSAHAGLMGLQSQADISNGSRIGSTRMPPAIAAPAPTLVTPMPMPVKLDPIGETVVTPMPARLDLVEETQVLPLAGEEAASVPEPGTVATLVLGLALMGALARRRGAPRR